MRNVLSIDFEDWFHICEVEHLLPRAGWDAHRSILDAATDWLLAELARRRARATFFVVGYCARRHPDLIRRLAGEGHEIAYHTGEHTLVHRQDPAAFRRDLRQGKALLRELTGRGITGFRAPQWSLGLAGPWAVDALTAEGFAYDSSRAPLPVIGRPEFPETVHFLPQAGGHDRLVEVPPLVLALAGLRLPAGGGWGLRTLPLPAILAKVRRHNRAGSPATFFFHPAEFVPHPTPAGLPLAKRFVCSFGLRDTRRAWDYLFDHLHFGSMGEAVRDWLAARGETVRTERP